MNGNTVKLNDGVVAALLGFNITPQLASEALSALGGKFGIKDDLGPGDIGLVRLNSPELWKQVLGAGSSRNPVDVHYPINSITYYALHNNLPDYYTPAYIITGPFIAEKSSPTSPLCALINGSRHKNFIGPRDGVAAIQSQADWPEDYNTAARYILPVTIKQALLPILKAGFKTDSVSVLAEPGLDDFEKLGITPERIINYLDAKKRLPAGAARLLGALCHRIYDAHGLRQN